MDILHAIEAATPETIAGIAVAAIKRIGELGLEAGEAFAARAEELAGDIHFEEGLAQINA